MNAQVIDFPYAKISEIEPHEAKILTFPVRQIDMSYLAPFALAVMWMELWKV
jgi:hypothetical protein